MNVFAYKKYIRTVIAAVCLLAGMAFTQVGVPASKPKLADLDVADAPKPAAAPKLTVVVGAVGKDPKPGLSKALEMQIKAAFVKDGRITAVTREEAVLAAVDNEQTHQRTGAVDDAQIKQIGKQLGARYVCVVEVAPLMNSYTLNAQFVDIVSTSIVSVVSVTSTLRNTTEFHKASEELVRKLLGHSAATASVPAAVKNVPIKHVAVIETQTDEKSGEAKDITPGDLSEITNVLRREAVKNLPRNQFNVMTSETVQSMGNATAEDCAGENCIITLGSKIGADYVVRGTLGKHRGRYSLTIEIFETEYGNLVAVTPSPIRTADLEELLDKSEAGCAAMYKNFAGISPQTGISQKPASPPVHPKIDEPIPPSTATPQPAPVATTPPQDKKSSSLKLTLRVSTAALAVGGIAGGIYYNGKGDDEYDKFKAAPEGSPQEAKAKKNTESHASTRNLLYILGGVGLAGLTLTFVF